MAEALWQEFRKYQSEDAGHNLIMAYLPLVKRVAGRITLRLPNHLDREDLVSYGILGLMDAMQKFNPEHGVKFENYAYTRIKGSIYDEIRKNSFLPRNVIKLIKDYSKAQAELENLYGGEVNAKQVADKLGITEEEVDQILQYVNMLSITSLDEIFEFKDRENSPKLDFVEDEKSPDPLTIIEKDEEQRILSLAIDNLAERDKIILSLYYFEELTLMEIGQVLEVSESRVCQLHARAITRLKTQLELLKFKKVE